MWCSACLIFVGRCLTCRSPRAHHFPHSLLVQPLLKNTQHNRYNMIISKNTEYIPHISKLSQSTCSAIKNHSGVKTCRVAETRARQLPQNTRGSRENGRGWNWTFGHCAGKFEEMHVLPVADHCASRWNGRSHFVVPFWTK